MVDLWGRGERGRCRRHGLNLVFSLGLNDGGGRAVDEPGRAPSANMGDGGPLGAGRARRLAAHGASPPLQCARVWNNE